MTFQKIQKKIKKIKLTSALATAALAISIINLNFITASSRMVFLPSEYISYSPAKSEAKIYGDQDLTIAISDFSDAQNGDTCQFYFAEYGRETAGTIYQKEAEYQNGKCEQILTAEEQNLQAWSISIRIKTQKNTFRNDTSYLFKAGPVGVVNVDVE